MLQPVSPVERIHALFLTGRRPGAAGVRRRGALPARSASRLDWGTPELRIPMVVSAVIDDLRSATAASAGCRRGVKACAAASRPVPEGNVGAGAGATVGRCTAAAEWAA